MENFVKIVLEYEQLKKQYPVSVREYEEEHVGVTPEEVLKNKATIIEMAKQRSEISRILDLFPEAAQPVVLFMGIFKVGVWTGEKIAYKDENGILRYDIEDYLQDLYVHYTQEWIDFCTSAWKVINKVPCYSMYNYYPTTCEFEATQDMWNIRRMIWNFKFNPNKGVTQNSHDVAMKKVVDDAEKVLKFFFSKVFFSPLSGKSFFEARLPEMTLVCIPASTQAATDRRYRDFSDLLCKKTGMENGYGHIQVQESTVPKHEGGSGLPSIHIDDAFFKNKVVLMFDDVVTSGRSMKYFKDELTRIGAIVVGGLTIGITRHNVCDCNPIDNLIK